MGGAINDDLAFFDPCLDDAAVPRFGYARPVAASAQHDLLRHQRRSRQGRRPRRSRRLRRLLPIPGGDAPSAPLYTPLLPPPQATPARPSRHPPPQDRSRPPAPLHTPAP